MPSIEDINSYSFINSIGPDIWKAICLLTQPISSKAKKGSEASNHLHKIRRFYCLSVILFSTNSECSFSLHTLITDVKTCGGSARQQKLLNRLGACASIDKHARYVQYRIQK